MKSVIVASPLQEINHMPENEFADISRDLYAQIKIVEDLVSDDLYKEAGKMLSEVEAHCNSLESLMEEDNKIQVHIVANRRREIGWIQDAIEVGQAKAKAKPVKRRITKKKTL
jgi:hypothetical protein